MSIISLKEKKHLRELANKQAEYANLPIMKEREAKWYKHNNLQGDLPIVVMEEQTFLPEIIPELQCESDYAKNIERQLIKNITVHEKINDDKVIPDFFAVSLDISSFLWQNPVRKTYSEDGLGYHIDEIIEDLEEDLYKIKPSIYTYNKEKTLLDMNIAEDVLGDILKIKQVNELNYWNCGITQKIVDLMGMENMFCSMLTQEDLFHKLIAFVTDDIIRCLRWQENNDLLFSNNKNDYMGSGSYCFNNEIGVEKTSNKIISTDTWGHINSQESVGISPKMYHEFIYPYYKKLAKEFGLIYYGCCEPVHDFWIDSIQKYDNLRKVSISPWCDEEFMSEQLCDGKVIYSRKPSPNYIGITGNFEEDEFRKHIRKTMSLTKKCKKEFIFRDIYKLNGNIDKISRAVKIVREESLL